MAAERGTRAAENLRERLEKWRDQGWMFWWGLVVRACARGRSCDEVLDDGGAGKDSPAAGGDAGSRRGRHSHVNMQFSCSFFLHGEEAPNERLCERAGRCVGDAGQRSGRRLQPPMELAGGVAARKVVAGNGSSKPVAAVSGVSTDSPRY